MRALVTAMLVAAPSLAMACPTCASRSQSQYVSFLIGGMIVLPFVVTTFVVRAIRRAGESTQ